MTSAIRRALAALLLLAVVVGPAPAAAQEEAEHPWAVGVPQENRSAALKLFKEGNDALRESLFKLSEEKYRAALALWDHPGIHYNLALTLVNLDKPVDAHQHLQAALKYGEVPLDKDKYAQAERYVKLIEGQITMLDVRCDVEGAVVKLDGRDLFTGPGRYRGFVRSGPHSLVAAKEGLLTHAVNEALVPGETRVVTLAPRSDADLTEYRRKWEVWIPWAVVAGGAAVIGTGVGMHLGARGAYQAYDAGIQACAAAGAGGCYPAPALQAERSKGDSLQALAFVGYGLGGAAVVTGAVLVYVNRLQPYRKDVQAPVATVAPLLGPGLAGATLQVTF